MLKDKIVKLDDGRSYLVITDLSYADRLFVMCSEVDLEKDTINEDEFVVREVVANGDDVNLISLKDDQELEAVTKLIISKAHLEF